MATQQLLCHVAQEYGLPVLIKHLCSLIIYVQNLQKKTATLFRVFPRILKQTNVVGPVSLVTGQENLRSTFLIIRLFLFLTCSFVSAPSSDLVFWHRQLLNNYCHRFPLLIIEEELIFRNNNVSATAFFSARGQGCSKQICSKVFPANSSALVLEDGFQFHRQIALPHMNHIKIHTIQRRIWLEIYKKTVNMYLNLGTSLLSVVARRT